MKENPKRRRNLDQGHWNNAEQGKNGKMKTPWGDKAPWRLKFARVILTLVLTLTIGLAAAIPAFFAVTIAGAPDISALDAEPEGYRTAVLDDRGETVLTLSESDSNRVYVKLENIPVNLQHAFVAIEDERFYQHNGIDIQGILRAGFKGIAGGNFSEGASTITQQLLKNNVFSGWTEEVTFADRLTRKIQEQYLALKLEQKLDKNWILENYLNTINLGGGNWGVETASVYYFGKDVSRLDLAECAVLAAITNNPTAYNPLLNPEANKERQQLVLANMLDLGYISQQDYDNACQEDVYGEISAAHASGSQAQVLNYFEDAMVQEVKDDLTDEKGMSEQDAWDLIYRGGLTIYSTEDSGLQERAEKEVNKDDYLSYGMVLPSSDSSNDGTQISLVLLDNATGQVKAIVGGRGEKNASLVYNRAISSRRQPGSTVKVIGEYAAGLQNGTMTLGTVYDDAPYTYSDGTPVSNVDGSYKGRTTVHDAIVSSDNIAAVKAAQEVGVDRVYAQLENFGITTLTEDDRVEALALGGTSGGVTNLEMTAAYESLACGGTWKEPVFYTKVCDRDGNIILSKDQEQKEVVSKETASLLTHAMADVMTKGTGQDAYFEGMPLAGKSGTTDHAENAWFIGYSPYYTCGVWGGYDDGRTQTDTTYVKKIWKAAMQAANADVQNKAFEMPSDMEEVKICTKSGKRAIPGVCDSTEQGDMTRIEYFAPGTAPTESCDEHIKITICRESGEKAGNWCPSYCEETKIYLRHASEGTADQAYVLPDGLEESACHVHTAFWDKWKKPDNNYENQTGENGTGPGESEIEPEGHAIDTGDEDNDIEQNSNTEQDSGTDSDDPFWWWPF
ncbi:MAG: PBP1A family penicillin-binding protein [Eubacterium sp.]|nr:PBP1A family penicillin-binding protein [Eubacterium sp.]